MELPLPYSSSSSSSSRFPKLRGIRWRIDLGILPSSPSASIDQLRKVTAESRRRYASLRRRLLVDPHLPKDGSRSPDLTMDNPLSQNPESTWGRFFRNAELEKLLDQDLSRLYPEHESYFHSNACQALLRRILLVWCLRHPEYGYRQGMHELLAPLLYVLHVDLQYLSQVRALYEDCFSDEFDEMSFPEGDLISNIRFTKSSSLDSRTDKDSLDEEETPKITNFEDLDPEAKQLFLLSDTYGPEGELGVILSERFMEHDAYCMFDGLLSGSCGVVAMADLFAHSPTGSSKGIPPVIEASAALYHLLSVVDSSLHTHLIDLGIEPQYFALRWLRVLFGREFSLNNLLLIWDELFSACNTSLIEDNHEYNFKILCCPRGALISAVAVSMLLHLRSSLLATENATTCLQRLLNFPQNIDVRKLIDKAKSWQGLAFETNIISSSSSWNSSSPEVSRIHSLPTHAVSPRTPNQLVHDSYWEEKWRVLNKDGTVQKNDGSGRIKKLLGETLGLSRSDLEPLHAKKNVRRHLFNNINDVKHEQVPNGVPELVNQNDGERGNSGSEESGRSSDCSIGEVCHSGENSSVLSAANNNCHPSAENDHENDSERSSVTSSSSIIDNEEEVNRAEESVAGNVEKAHSVVDMGDVASSSDPSISATIMNEDAKMKHEVVSKDRRTLLGRLQWFLRFGKASGEDDSEKESSHDENVVWDNPGSSTSDSNSSRGSGRVEVGDKKVTAILKNLGQSMLENIQVIESVFQQERGQASNILAGKGQATGMTALKELRKISNLLSEM